jgi:hypothetical protein
MFGPHTEGLISSITGFFLQFRAPLTLKYPMLAYNLFQVFFNLWVFLGKFLKK